LKVTSGPVRGAPPVPAIQHQRQSELDPEGIGPDRFALYASAATGFSPQAFVELFDRSPKTKGKGNLLTDFFAAANSDTRRLREIKKTLKRLPVPCREIAPASSNEFRTWQAAVMSHPDFGTHDD
jgi:hypothetical protein